MTTENGEHPRERAKGPSAWDTALRLLGVRARSQHEIVKHLGRRGFDAETVNDVIVRLDRAGLLDDAEFASEWVRSRHRHSHRGRLALRHELIVKGVEAQTIEDALADIDPDDERAAAADLVHKKLTATVTAAIADDRGVRDKHFRRLVGMLVRRGYSQSLAIGVVAEQMDALT